MTEVEFYQLLGTKVKEARESSGLNLTQLANKVGVDRALLYQFENTGKKVSAYRLSLILKALKFTTIEDLFDQDELQKKNSPLLSMASA